MDVYCPLGVGLAESKNTCGTMTLWDLMYLIGLHELCVTAESAD